MRNRIISTVPSLTELLYHLGLQEEVIGITKYCVHPNHWATDKNIIGGTKNLNLDLIESLNPTLIIANKEENVKEQIEYLQSKFKVLITDIKDYDDALEAILKIGRITNCSEKSKHLTQEIEQLASSCNANFNYQSFLYFIWRKPYMIAGDDTFIHAICNKLKLRNLAMQNRYPEINLDKIVSLSPDIIFLSSEPFPFKEKHINELQSHLPYTKIVLVDGEMFSWYGSRMLEAFPYFQNLAKSLANSGMTV